MPGFQIIPCNNGTSLPQYQACYNSQMEEDFDVSCEKPLCWETYLGKQFYFLTLFDFVVQVNDRSGFDPEMQLIILKSDQLNFRI